MNRTCNVKLKDGFKDASAACVQVCGAFRAGMSKNVLPEIAYSEMNFDWGDQQKANECMN